MTPPRLKWILAEPSGGLCNRLRTLVSCQILAESTGSRVQLLWRPRPNCRCRFSDLFRNDRSLKVVPPRYQRASRRIGLPRFPRVRAGAGRSLSQEDLAELGWVIDPQPLRVGSYLHFDGCFSDFVPAGMSDSDYDRRVSHFLCRLSPAPPVWRRLTDVPPGTIGVHVRRTDNAPAIRVSTLDKFIARMEQHVEMDDSTCFFLASDDPDVDRRLLAYFGDRVLTIPKRQYARNTTEAIQDAAVDLLMLSRCREIIGSHYSSFSEYASMFRQIDLHIVGVGKWEGPARAIRRRPEERRMAAEATR